jgi:hypothetical protein
METDGAVYELNTQVSFRSQKSSCPVVLIKRGHVIEAEKSIAEQVRITSISDGNPYETLLSYMVGTITPYFKSYVRETGRGDR